jgi:hypothetical protein
MTLHPALDRAALDQLSKGFRRGRGAISPLPGSVQAAGPAAIRHCQPGQPQHLVPEPQRIAIQHPHIGGRHGPGLIVRG